MSLVCAWAAGVWEWWAVWNSKWEKLCGSGKRELQDSAYWQGITGLILAALPWT